MKAYFVTGTDTGVGKTTVSRALLAAAAKRGLRARGVKPAESGCARTSQGELVPADALALASASSTQPEPLCLYRFEEAVAPGVAADAHGITIEFERIQALVQRVRADSPDLVIVEGAGGLLVPMGQQRTIADLARMLALPLLIVARPGLGTINHTLLTIEVARGRGLEIVGVIFSRPSAEEEPLLRSNATEIVRGASVRYLGCLSHVPSMSNTSMSDAALSAAAATDLDCDWLLGG